MSDSSSDSEVVLRPAQKKRAKNLRHWVDALPQATSYTRSYRGLSVTSLATQSSQGLVALGCKTGSLELRQHRRGELQLIRRLEGIFSSMIMQMEFSCDGANLAVIAQNGTIGIVDTRTADISVIRNPQTDEKIPTTLAWTISDTLWIAYDSSVAIYNSTLQLIRELGELHKSAVLGLRYSAQIRCMTSWDDQGMIEIWGENGGKPEGVSFQTKSDTELFYLRKLKRRIRDICVSSRSFAVLDTDGRIVVFDLKSAKRRKEFDESVSTLQEMNKLGTGIVISSQEFEDRKQRETKTNDQVTFDASGNFLVYPTLLGIKALNLKTSTITKFYGLNDGIRLHQVSLVQQFGRRLTVETAGAENQIVDKQTETDSAIIALDASGNVYLFGNEVMKPRDIELGRNVSIKSTTPEPVSKEVSARGATFHTSMGDIAVELYPTYAPKEVNYFVQNCEKGRYNGTSINQVIKNNTIRVQIMDGNTMNPPIHKKPANEIPARVCEKYSLTASPDGSQFYIIIGDGKQTDTQNTVFGKVRSGFDVIDALNSLEIVENRPIPAPIVYSTSVDS